jgi:hypothetical protein
VEPIADSDRFDGLALTGFRFAFPGFRRSFGRFGGNLAALLCCQGFGAGLPHPLAEFPQLGHPLLNPALTSRDDQCLWVTPPQLAGASQNIWPGNSSVIARADYYLPLRSTGSPAPHRFRDRTGRREFIKSAN